MLAWLSLMPADASAARFPLPSRGGNIIGAVQVTYSRRPDTLSDIARRFDLGFEQILTANPHVDAWLPGKGTRILIPSRYILPDAPHRGIVVNLAEMRLYYFPAPGVGGGFVYTYPVSIGRRDWRTPLMRTRILRKVENPAWYPPLSIRIEHAAAGHPLPKVVPPGTSNPLGRRALILDTPGYLIHGTNRSYGIGLRASHGCIRMYPEDIEELFRMVRVGTPVYIVHQPVKVGYLHRTIYIEAHGPLRELDASVPPWSDLLLETVRTHMIAGRIDWVRAERVVHRRRGIPLPVAWARR